MAVGGRVAAVGLPPEEGAPDDEPLPDGDCCDPRAVSTGSGATVGGIEASSGPAETAAPSAPSVVVTFGSRGDATVAFESWALVDGTATDESGAIVEAAELVDDAAAAEPVLTSEPGRVFSAYRPNPNTVAQTIAPIAARRWRMTRDRKRTSV